MGHLVVDADEYGPFVTITCAARACGCHVALRPAAADQTLYDLVCAAYDFAAEDGWRFAGAAWCPEHVPARLERAATLSAGFDWLNVQRQH